MELITILNRCHRFRVLSTSRPTSVPDKKSIEWPYDAKGSVHPLALPFAGARYGSARHNHETHLLALSPRVQIGCGIDSLVPKRSNPQSDAGYVRGPETRGGICAGPDIGRSRRPRRGTNFETISAALSTCPKNVLVLPDTRKPLKETRHSKLEWNAPGMEFRRCNLAYSCTPLAVNT